MTSVNKNLTNNLDFKCMVVTLKQQQNTYLNKSMKLYTVG